MAGCPGSRLGVGDFVLKNGPDRAPRWPAGVVGSISHAGSVPGGFCGAVVAHSRDFLTLGLDAEVVDGVGPDLWPRVTTPRERDWLERQPLGRRPVLAGGRLIVVSPEGAICPVAPQPGAVQNQTVVRTPISVAPVVANSTLYILGDDGRLIAFR